MRGDANEAVYAATTHGQGGLAGALDRELRRDGIRVTALCPAGVTTEFALGAGRVEGDPELDAFLQPEDIAFQVLTCLQQPGGCGARCGASGAWLTTCPGRGRSPPLLRQASGGGAGQPTCAPPCDWSGAAAQMTGRSSGITIHRIG